MPVYAWKGLDLSGRVAKGTLFARSVDDLEGLLLKKNIGLIQARPSLVMRGITPQERYAFFSHLSSLLNAHIPLHKALTIIASTAKNSLRMLVTDCAALIAEGMPLSEALKIHTLSDDLSYAMITVGEKTGDMGRMLGELAEHMTIMNEFKQKIRSSLTGPLITLCIFFLVMMAIFIGVIPRFEVYFASYNAPLPFPTKSILAISSFIRSWYMMGAVLASILAGGLIRLLLKATEVNIGEGFGLKMPVISSFYRTVHQARFFTTLSMLMKNSIPLSQALQITESTLSQSTIKKEIRSITKLIESGQLLSAGVSQSLFACPEIDACIVVGESSGSLEVMLSHISETCRQKVYRAIARYSTLIQPVLLLILGALIACLIFAIYMPILTISSILG